MRISRRLRPAGSIVGTLVLSATALFTSPAIANTPSAARAALVAKVKDSLTIGCDGSVPFAGVHHFRSAQSIAGHPGFRLGYSGNAKSQTSGIVIDLLGFENGRPVWIGIGERQGIWAGEVPWGNTLAQPEIRARASGTGGTVSFSPCKWEGGE